MNSHKERMIHELDTHYTSGRYIPDEEELLAGPDDDTEDDVIDDDDVDDEEDLNDEELDEDDLDAEDEAAPDDDKD
jgi:hypothetical protein